MRVSSDNDVDEMVLSSNGVGKIVWYGNCVEKRVWSGNDIDEIVWLLWSPGKRAAHTKTTGTGARSHSIPGEIFAKKI